MTKRFFIVGCQRSGTTLLRLILDSHSKITCLDEVTSYDVLSDKTKLKQVYENNKTKEWVGFKIPRFTQQIDQSVLHDWKLDMTISNFYEHDPLLFIVRDCRDTVCSLLNLIKLNGKEPLTEWAIPIMHYWKEKSPTFKIQFDTELDIISNSQYPVLATLALYWKFKNLSYFEYVKRKYPVFQIKYEELVINPRNSIGGMLEFLDLNWEDSVLKHYLLEHSEVDPNGMTVGYTNARMPISNFHVGQYLEKLSQDEINEIMLISGDVMKSFGYV